MAAHATTGRLPAGSPPTDGSPTGSPHAGSPHAGTDDLGLLLARASHALATEHAAALSTIGITPRSFCVLHQATRADLTQVQLAERCGLDKTTMVVTVDELEQAGLAERRRSPTDRRARIISVTDAGRRKVAQGRRIVDEVHAGVLGVLSAGQREALLEALARLVAGPLSAPVACEPAIRRPRSH